MKTKLMTAALAATMTLGSIAPALADGAASTRNIILGAGAAALIVSNISRKNKAKKEEQRQQSLRQTQYRQYYYHKYGYYPSAQQYRDWYYRTYGVYPA